MVCAIPLNDNNIKFVLTKLPDWQTVKISCQVFL